jgi:hypothetical protein
MSSGLMRLLILKLVMCLSALLALGPGARAEVIGQARNLHLNDLAQELGGEEVVLLGEGDEAFLGLSLQQRTNTPQGAVLILHDKGQNPNWPVHLQQARLFLPDVGWNTLSIALPLIGGYTTDAETTLNRIALGMQRLNQDGQFNLVILGYGEGAYWAARYLSERQTLQDDTGFGLMMVNVKTIAPDLPELVGGLNIPVLDWISQTSPATVRAADQRQAQARRNGLGRYTQIRDPEQASYYSQATPNRTTRRLWGWLRTRMAGREGEFATVTEEQ